MEKTPPQSEFAALRSGEVQCPICSELTDSLKQYEFDWIVFVLHHSSHQKVRYAACPSCMRRYLARYALISLLVANLLWPVAVLPKASARLIATFLDGHSVKQASFGRTLVRDVAMLGLLGSLAFAIVAGLSLSF